MHSYFSPKKKTFLISVPFVWNSTFYPLIYCSARQVVPLSYGFLGKLGDTQRRHHYRWCAVWENWLFITDHVSHFSWIFVANWPSYAEIGHTFPCNQKLGRFRNLRKLMASMGDMIAATLIGPQLSWKQIKISASWIDKDLHELHFNFIVLIGLDLKMLDYYCLNSC